MQNGLKIPPTEEIIREAREAVNRKDPAMSDPDFVRNHFSDSLEALFKATYATYTRYEKEKVERETYRAIDEMKKDSFTKAEVKKVAKEIAESSIRMEKSLKQSRVSRAGRSFVIIVQSLLDDIGIPNESATRGKKGTNLHLIDLVIPNKKTAINTPDKAHFLSLKTSLRERWMQVAAKQSQGQRTHLLTLLQSETLSKEMARKITDRGIFLYIPDNVKNDRFSDEPGIRGLSALPSSVG